VLVAAGGCTAVAWLILSMQATDSGWDHLHLLTPQSHPLSLAGISAAWLMWMTMMAAMMVPALTPWLLAFAATETAGRAALKHTRTVLFAMGYAVVWGGFSLGAATAQVVLLQHGMLDWVLAGHTAHIGAALLMGAGVYQLSSAKAACLEHCRSPMGFFLSSWHGGSFGAFRMGIEHGTFCLGCCWALMTLSFALGVMNLLWMALLTVVLCAEKLARRGRAVGQAFGIALFCWGLLLAFVVPT
jgi:predicted metal-binding membrane protein